MNLTPTHRFPTLPRLQYYSFNRGLIFPFLIFACLLATEPIWGQAPVSLWNGEGDARDVMGANAGTNYGALFATGQLGQGFLFDNSVRYVLIPCSPTLLTPNYSVEVWVNPARPVDDPTGQDVIFEQESGRAQMVVRPGTTGVIPVFQFGTGDSVTYPAAVSPIEIPIGSFTHLAGTWDGQTIRLYVNGINVAQTTPPAGVTPLSTCPHDFFIGGLFLPGFSGQFFDGIIDQCAYFDRVLSSDEVLYHYRRDRLAGRIDYWPGENDARDMVGNNPGTVIGGITFPGGQVGKSFNGDGTSGCVAIPDSPSLVPNAYSLEVWLNPSGQIDPSGQALVFGQALGFAQMVVRSQSNGLFPVFQFGYGSFTDYPAAVSAVSLPLNSFSHLVGTWDGIDLKLYVNAVLTATTNAQGHFPWDSS